jgi:hypothetical protein
LCAYLLWVGSHDESGRDEHDQSLDESQRADNPDELQNNERGHQKGMISTATKRVETST